MPRANRHHVPGYIWHITQRCHRRQFLLQFARDRRAWVRWLYVARHRYGLCVLNYTVTSNHVHLLVRDQGRGEIACSLQLIAGRSGQAYNQRKGRHGAFWEDRYHATAVDTGEHLARCLVYIDLNMVRAGRVAHPAQWREGGYHEIQVQPLRYRVVDREALAAALGLDDVARLADVHREWVEGALRATGGRRPEWTEAVAVGGRAFVERITADLGSRVRHREVDQSGAIYCLREEAAAYAGHSAPQSDPLGAISSSHQGEIGRYFSSMQRSDPNGDTREASAAHPG